MSQDQALTQLVDKIFKTCKEQWKIIEKYIDEQQLDKLPLYDELRDPEFFTNESARCVALSKQNHFLKMKIAKITIDITTLINEIGKYQLTSVNQNNLRGLKEAKEKCSLYASALDDYQKGLNQAVKYLEMCSYTMNSPYRE